VIGVIEAVGVEVRNRLVLRRRAEEFRDVRRRWLQPRVARVAHRQRVLASALLDTAAEFFVERAGVPNRLAQHPRGVRRLVGALPRHRIHDDVGVAEGDDELAVSQPGVAAADRRGDRGVADIERAGDAVLPQEQAELAAGHSSTDDANPWHRGFLSGKSQSLRTDVGATAKVSRPGRFGGTFIGLKVDAHRHAITRTT
jgi:hypothetical protein